MKQVSIVCPCCNVLIAVVDKTVADHGGCAMSGMRYVPSPAKFSAGPGGPKIELLASRLVDVPCSEAGHHHQGLEAIVKIHAPNPSLN